MICVCVLVCFSYLFLFFCVVFFGDLCMFCCFLFHLFLIGLFFLLELLGHHYINFPTGDER